MERCGGRGEGRIAHKGSEQSNRRLTVVVMWLRGVPLPEEWRRWSLMIDDRRFEIGGT